MAKITLVGMKDWYDIVKHVDFFSTLTLPTGIDKDVIVDRLLYRSSDFEVLYSNPEYVHNSFTAFSKSWEKTFEKWYNALEIDYEPLNNYDRTETRTHSLNDTTKRTGNETDANLNVRTGNETDASTNAKTGTEGNTGSNVKTGSEGVENTTSAYNASGYSPKDKTDTTYNSVTDTASNTHTYNVNDSLSNTHTFNNVTDTESKTHTYNDVTDNKTVTENESIRAYGNIGVTTSQQMLQSEIDIAKWNLYENIVDIIIKEYCLFIY